MGQLSNTATPKYYGQFRDAVLAGEVPVNREISLEMNRIDALIADRNVYYDEKAMDGFVAFCEAELSEYCRRKAVHPEQLRQWRAACEGANGDGRPVSGSTPVVNPSALERLRELERELRRKDAALAEAAALLMLRKKADAIWGTEEDE